MRKILSIFVALLSICAIADNIPVFLPADGGSAGQVLVSRGPHRMPHWQTAGGRQLVLNLAHPVGSIHVQYTVSDNPNTLFNKVGEYSSTWADITSEYDGRYFRALNAATACTKQDEEMPAPQFAYINGHSHGHGSMKIYGQAGGFTSNAIFTDYTDGPFQVHDSGMTWSSLETSGTAAAIGWTFDAYDGHYWTGRTSSQTDQSTQNVQPPYKTTATHLIPNSYTVKIWRRTN